MPIIKAQEKRQREAETPLSGWGVFIVRPDQAPSDLHFHDCDEYWLIVRGRARVRCGDEEQVMERGDLLYARIGELHQVVEVLSEEPFEGVYLEAELRGQRRRGHLHPGKDALPEVAADEVKRTGISIRKGAER
ncbi:MAG: hypothetical protein KatS3mg115_2475 [Candidatus Poribacteria bacterium]|nr:MAG: hypothetical protein KatS3mg115_2475 [Candidatus Poribacteria bacterium]